MFLSKYSQQANDKRGSVGQQLLFNIAGRANLASQGFNEQEALRIFTSQEAALIALHSALGTLSPSNQNTYLIPYGSAVMFEFRNVSETWYVNTRVGIPVLNNVNWDYQFAPIDINCGGQMMEQCPLDTFFNSVKNPYPSEDQFCCYRPPAFYESKCDDETIDPENLPQACVLYRTFCPDVACKDNFYVDSSDLACVASGSTEIINNETTKSNKTAVTALAVLLAFSLLGLFVALYALNKKNSASSNDYLSGDASGNFQRLNTI